MGRAIIAVLPEAEREEILARAAARSPEHWAKIKDAVERALIHYRRFGYTLSVGDWEDGVNAVGVPLVTSDGSGVFAFNCGAPSFLISPERLDEDIGPRLVELVHKVESVLNGRR